jgi:hypothetical protein
VTLRGEFRVYRVIPNMFLTEDILFSITVITILFVTSSTLGLVTSRKFGMARKYTLMMSILLLLSVIHNLCMAIQFALFHSGIATDAPFAFMQPLSALVLCTLSISQAELLNYFSVIASFWNPQRVWLLQSFLMVLYLMAVLPVIAEQILRTFPNQIDFIAQVVSIDLVEGNSFDCLCKRSLFVRVLGHHVLATQSISILSTEQENDHREK